MDKNSSEFFIGKRCVAYVCWHANGEVEYERYFDDQGHIHGVERHGFDDGRTMYRARWIHGQQHGLQEQWDVHGNLLVRTRFVRGTGVDLWFDGVTPFVSESREYTDGTRHGFERWWKDRTHVYSEGHFWQGYEHGIFREWNEAGRLRRGFPRYFTQGKRVTKRQYLRSRATDATLPPIDERDAAPRRRPVRVPLE